MPALEMPFSHMRKMNVFQAFGQGWVLVAGDCSGQNGVGAKFRLGRESSLDCKPGYLVRNLDKPLVGSLVITLVSGLGNCSGQLDRFGQESTKWSDCW